MAAVAVIVAVVAVLVKVVAAPEPDDAFGTLAVTGAAVDAVVVQPWVGAPSGSSPFVDVL